MPLKIKRHRSIRQRILGVEPSEKRDGQDDSSRKASLTESFGSSSDRSEAGSIAAINATLQSTQAQLNNLTQPEKTPDKNINEKWIGCELGRASLENTIRAPDIVQVQRNQAAEQQNAMKVEMVRDGIIDPDKTDEKAKAPAAEADGSSSLSKIDRLTTKALTKPEEGDVPELMVEMEKYGIE